MVVAEKPVQERKRGQTRKESPNLNEHRLESVPKRKGIKKIKAKRKEEIE